MKLYRAKTPSRAIEKTVDLVEKAGENLDKKVFVFCESRSTLSYEMGIAERTGGSFSTSVMSFSRYVGLFGKIDKYLGKTAATLVVRRIIEQNAASLTRLRRGTANLAVNVYNIISQLKAAKVTTLDVDGIVSAEGGAFGSKLKDIAFIYSEYERFIAENGYTDENGYLSLMPELLRRDKSLKGATVIVSGIGNLTKKTVDIILALDALADLTVVTVSHDAPGYTNEIYYKILALFKDCEVFDDGTLPPEQEALINGLYDPACFKKVGLYSDKVKIFEHPDVTAEARAVAKRIRYDVVTKGCRYSDFVIVAGNVSLYAPLYQRVFEEYEIPLYADVKRPLSAHPLVALITGLIDCRRLNFKPSVCLSVVKNACAFSSEQANAFENYFLKVTPSRSMMAKPFSEPCAEQVRKTLVDLVSTLKKKDTVNGYIEALLNIFAALGVTDKTALLSEKLDAFGEAEIKSFNTVGEKSFYSAITEICSVMGDNVVDLELMKSLISSAVGATEISIIATRADSVFFGDTKTAPLRVAKTLFAIGFDSSIPDVRADTSLLCDKDLIRLESYQCVIEPKLKVVNVRERENVLTSLLSFRDKLIVSFARLGFRAEKNVKGDIIDYLENIFGITARRPDDEKAARLTAREDYMDYLSKRSALKGALVSLGRFSRSVIDGAPITSAYIDYAKNDDKSAYNFINAYFSNEKGGDTSRLEYKGNISASLVETYFSCPYKAFGERVLRLKELSTGDAAAYEIGNIFHYTLDKFVSTCDFMTTAEQAERLSAKMADEVFLLPEFSRYLNKKQYEHLFPIIKKEVIAACMKVFFDLKSSDFRVMGTEIFFSDVPGSDFGAINIETVNGTKKVTGYIDRVDRCGDYVRIIDYKTGNVSEKSSVESLYSGTSVQLYLYMNALGEKYTLAAAHYLEISDAFVEEGQSPINYVGNVLANNDVIAKLDKNAVDGDSKTYSVRHTKKGEFDSRAHVLTGEQLNSYVIYAKKVTESGANEIYGGKFLPSPFKTDACTFCRLKGMCGYDCETGGRTRSFAKDSVDKNVIIAAVRKVNGDE